MTDQLQSTTGSRARPRLLAVLVLVAVATSAMIGGVALDRLVLLPRAFAGRFGPGGPGAFGGRPGFGGGPARGREPSPETRRRFSDQMAKDLALTPAQQMRVDSVLTRQMDAMRRATDAVRPAVDSIARDAQAAIDAILSPQQLTKVRSFRGRMGSPPMRPMSPP